MHWCMAEKLQYGHLNFFLITVNSFTERQRPARHQQGLGCAALCPTDHGCTLQPSSQDTCLPRPPTRHWSALRQAGVPCLQRLSHPQPGGVVAARLSPTELRSPSSHEIFPSRPRGRGATDDRQRAPRPKAGSKE
ncbi:hypothetical protein P7K49_010121 [Saguinus oedipus]|uniref:Uncharacterized protein n=1 Tax=Saguinus oedipus TaxID=9490 RepID=A0ABQ9VLW1_SAGOE|nr:hypothetical protein P7K49_010121 [Saguinus oedipus]